MIQNPKAKNLTTSQVFECVFNHGRFSTGIDAAVAFSDVTQGDRLLLGSKEMLVIAKESYAGKTQMLVGITCLPLDTQATLPNGDTIKVWSAPAGLPADDQAQLLTTAAALDSPLSNADKAITALMDAARYLPTGDELADAIKAKISSHKQQTRLITSPGSGFAIGMQITIAADQLQVTAVDRQSLKGLECLTCQQITAQVEVKSSNLFTKLTGAK